MADEAAENGETSTGDKPIGEAVESTVASKEKNRDVRLKNLIPFKPGQSGNPSGRPKGGVSLVTQLKKRLEEHPEEVESIINTAIEGAKAGDAKLLSIVLDRVDGPVKQEIEHSGALSIADILLSERKGELLDGDIPD